MPLGSSKPRKLLERPELLNYGVKLLSGRAMSVGDVKEKLRLKAAKAEDIDPVISSLKEYGYLNDKSFAASFANSRRDNQALGSIRVLRDLRTRRVPSTVAAEAVKQAFDGKDECELIEQFLERKYRSQNLGELLQDEKKLASVYRRLRTSGYSTGNSVRVLKRYAARAEELEGIEEPDTPEG